MTTISALAEGVAQQFEPLTLAELDAQAALDRRFDNKYIVSGENLQVLTRHLGCTHRVLEIDGRRLFEYRSVYFDSDSLLTYRSHIQGRRRRFKCRSRHYVDTDVHTFEVKLKGRRGMTVKRRIPTTSATFGTISSDAAGCVRRTG